MTFDANKVRAGETTPHHIVLKMLLVSVALSASSLALAFYLH